MILMKFMSRRLHVVLVTAAMACLSFGVAATMLSQTENFSIGPLDDVSFEAINMSDFDINNDIVFDLTINDTGPQSAPGPVMTFNQFDETLYGLLTGVMISFESTLGGDVSISLVYDQDGFGEGGTQVGAEGKLTLELGMPFGLLSPSEMAIGTAGCTDPQDATGCSDQTAISGTPGGMVGVSSLTPFIGTGTFDVTSSLTALLDVFTIPDNVTGGYVDNATLLGLLTDATASGSVTVKYTYGVPEPGVLILLLAGLAGVMVQHRRRRPSVSP